MNKRTYTKKKGQLFTQDFILSLLIFLMIVSLSISIWDNITEKTRNIDTVTYMQQKAFYITDILIKTKGYPENWNSTTVELIGLSTGKNHMIGIEKINMLDNISYDDIIEMWDINSFGFNMTFWNSTEIITSYGKITPYNATIVLPFTRIINIAYENYTDKGLFKFIFWKN
ncbi:MAG: hypothetical protein K0B02_03085 [DPANN group archaeon]|nr:hypothetical protein [DPANN group archaeon]